MKKVTFVLLTCGEHSESACIKAIQPFIHEVEFIKISHCYPQIKALNLMIESVNTNFFVPLDADMVLDNDAWPRIMNAIHRHEHDCQWHSILFNLWDTLTERQILALKILRTDVAKQNVFKDVPTPDVEHYKRLTELGYSCIHDYLKQKPIGKHIVAGRKFCYSKYRDVYQTYRTHNFEWDSAVFMGGNDIRSKAKAHFDFFLQKWLDTDNKDYLHCIAGMMDGILSPLDMSSKNLGNVIFKIKSSEAIDAFYEWYMNPLYKNHVGVAIF